ncbi:MAG: germination protein YpeB [Bacteroides sp.]|nr:germination protein YpeB [Bacillota bacterium]MCM1394071.1 germination protein YpeB [[Eubacterium] siraeum]MCM1455859.1 germination protein YpeB [Bacteroides sp.]
MKKTQNQQVTTSDNSQETKKKRGSQTKGKVIKTALLGTTLGLFASAIVGLSVALHFADKAVVTHETYQRQMDAVYSRAYFDLLDGASDLGINLRKIGVSNSPRMQQSLLYEVWSSANLAENSLAMFESNDDGVLQAQKFVNQLGDYSHSLARKVANGGTLSGEEREKLVKMGDMADVYMKALMRIQDDLDGGKTFVGDDGALEGFTSAFAQFAEPSFEYPEMIYDGPFSDALENRQPVALGDGVITEEVGAKLVADYLDGVDASNIEFAGEGNGDIPTLNYSLSVEGMDAFAQISRQGGKLVLFNIATADGAQQTVKQDAGPTCQQNALAFADKLGFKDMQVVWSSSMRGECYINLAPVQDGVILYSDLVKVKVRESDSHVIGLDATHYAFNHRERKIATPVISVDEAQQRLSIPAVSAGRLALIPLGGMREVLTYEFECEQDGTYFVYIDALNGEEANILFVIDDNGMGSRTI